MKKLLLTILFVFCVVGNSIAVQPPGFSSVQDVNDGTEGQILINTGDDHGNSDIGEWVDSDFLKGEDGERGIPGTNGINGIDGKNGNNGQDGNDGEDGEAGVNGTKGNEGKQGETGKEGKQGAKGDIGLPGKGMKNPRELQIEGVLKETKRTAWSIYFIQDFANDNNTIGAKVKVYIGQSYGDQVREELDKRLKKLEKYIDSVDLITKDDMEVVPTSTGLKIQKKVNF